MAVLITDTGRVDQRIVEVPGGVDPEQLARLRERVNTELGGVALADAATAFGGILERIEPDDRALAAPLVEALAEQVAANRHDRLVMAGAANLARTERDFTGSIFPVLEAMEEQVTILRLFGEMDLDADEVSARIGRENADYGLSETSVLASGYTAQGGSVARLGVLGPTRMDYSGNMVAVRAVARYLSRLLGDEN
jgi:heat-inducible transcriptional repressor